MRGAFTLFQEEINRWRYLDILEIGEPSENSLRLVMAEMKTSGPPIDIPVGSTVIRGTRAIKTDESCSVLEVVFPDYIAYAVRNESFIAGGQGGSPPDANLRTYVASPLLDYIASATSAGQDWPGPFVQYTFHGVNHLVDVASEQEPTFIRLA